MSRTYLITAAGVLLALVGIALLGAASHLVAWAVFSAGMVLIGTGRLASRN